MSSEPSLESDLKARKRYGRLAVICLSCLAILHGLHSFFFTFFFWLSAGFLGITLYYHILIKRQQNPSTSQFNWAQQNRNQPQQGAAPSQSKRMVMIIIMAVAGFFLLSIIIPVFFSSGESEESLEVTPIETQYTDVYQLALDQYNQKNYRESITLLRPELLSGGSNSQSMLLLGDSYYEEKNLDSAYMWYSSAYGLGERSANLSHLMAYILDQRGNTSDAIMFYKEAIGQDSARSDIFTRLAELEPTNAAWYLKKAEQFKSN